jgi:4-diphosphocytidyl-2-C-methyl-D-erythritol kinase
MESLEIRAYVKINLMLDVLYKRPDGYHEVEMIMQGINLFDLLEIKKHGTKLCLNCNHKELDNGPSNLAWQAAALLIKDFPNINGVEINLQKNIPVAAGLAGGSTDAAAVLLGMNELFDLNLDREKMLEYAAKLGSDVPFCLLPLTALAIGRGEKIRMLPICPRLWMVVAKPPFGVSTKEVYGHLSNVAILRRPDLQLALGALENNRVAELYKAMRNVLEYSTYDLHPELRDWANELQQIGATKVIMSGSGPTLIAFCENENAARMLAAKWQKPGWAVFTSKTLGMEEAADLSKGGIR